MHHQVHEDQVIRTCVLGLNQRRVLVLASLAFTAWSSGPGHAQAINAPVAGGTLPAAAAEHPCSAPGQVSIRAALATDAEAVCEGARRALDFLVHTALEVPRETRIDVVDELPGGLDGKAVGCFIPATRRIFLLSYRAFQATGTWFRLPVDRELYRAAASHEVAHAMVPCNAESGRLPLAAHEYVAYVAMFATLEPGLRQRVLAQFPGRGLANAAQIQLFVYLVNPLQFAADAWRHYLRQPDPAAWLRDIVAGRVVEEWPSEGP